MKIQIIKTFGVAMLICLVATMMPMKLPAAESVALAAGASRCEGSLIPDQPQGPGYDYFCTWAVQNYLFGQDQTNLTMPAVLRANGKEARRLFHEKYLMAADGWLTFFPQIRSDLWFLLDDGYYLQPGNVKTDMSGMEIDPAKFPSCTGAPPERQRILSGLVKQAGWRGLGLWSRFIRPESEARERVLWANGAQVGYWKVDGGDEACLYVKLRNALYPALVLEHAQGGEDPLNNFGGPAKGLVDPSYVSEVRRKFLCGSDVLRTYDADTPLNQVTTLARVAALLQWSAQQPAAKAIINCEDNISLGAALGCSAGIFRFPYVGRRPSGDPEIYLAGPRQPRKRMDEVVRGVRWHRVAPPFAANAQPVAVDDAVLTDAWKFKPGDSWLDLGECSRSQSAPARLARGLPLPAVDALGGPPPFVLASRHPAGPVSIATLGRIIGARYVIPLAEVSQKIPGNIPSAIGIFGDYHRLRLRFDVPISGRRIFAQDLMGGPVVDITGQVQVRGRELDIPGELVRKVGLAAATPGDLSDPGLVMVIRQPLASSAPANGPK